MTTPAEAPSDAELIARTREGDMAAYDELYRRYYDDASRVARIVTDNSDEAQDVVAEAFTRVLTRLRQGGGPDTELTPYLRTVVRRLAIDRHRSSQRDGKPADPSILEILPRTDDPMARATDRQLVRRAFETLPDRWQQVLWHTEIEGRSPASLAATLGSTPNAVAALAYRAREGLRQAYLAVNLSSEVRAECRPYAPKVAAYVRGTLSAQHTRAVTAHLGECEYCRERRDELLLLVSDLRGTLWPALLLPAALGAAAAGAAATTGAVAAAGGAAGSAAATGASGPSETAVLVGAGATAGAGASTAGTGASAGAGSAAGAVASPGRWARIGGKTLAGAAGVVAAGVIVAGAYLMTTGSSDDTNRAAPPPGTSQNVSTDEPDESTSDAGDPTPSDEPEDPDDPPSPDSDEPDDPPPAEGGVPVNNPDPENPGDPETPASTETSDRTDEPSGEPDDPTQPPEDDTPSAPSIDAAPQSTTVRAGQPASFAVQVSGSPTPSVVWQYRDASAAVNATAVPQSGTLTPTTGGGWKDIDGATSTTLRVPSTSPRHNGRQYRAVATNDHGEVTTSPALLTVQYAPEITANPSGATTDEGGAVTFTATARANPAPSSVSWQYRKPGGSWQNASSTQVTRRGATSTLELGSVDRELHGYEYRAVFANDVGSAQSRGASLSVHWAPTVVADPADANVSTGSQATFEATAEAGNPGSTQFRWQVRSGGDWRDLGGWQDGTTARRNVDVSSADQDRSEYRAVFRNRVGTSYSNPATLRVEANAAGSMRISPPGGGTNKDWCVQPDGGSADIHLDECSGSPPTWQVFTEYSETGPSGHTVRWADGRCLSVSPSPRNGNLPVELRACADDPDQVWRFDPADSDPQKIQTSSPLVGTEVCLDVEGGTIARFKSLIVYNCHGEPNQRFSFR